MAEMAELSTMRASSLLPSASLSASLRTGLTLYPRNKPARTATNSTCENFRPTHSRGPSAQGMKVPASGSMNSSLAIDVVGLWVLLDGGDEARSQRLGRQVRASEPQIWGSVWRACTLMLMAVLAGKTNVLSPRARLWGWKPVDFGMKTMEP